MLNRMRGSSWEYARTELRELPCLDLLVPQTCLCNTAQLLSQGHTRDCSTAHQAVSCLGGVRNKYVHFIRFSASYCLPCFQLLPSLSIKYLCFIYVDLLRKKKKRQKSYIHNTSLCSSLLFLWPSGMPQTCDTCTAEQKPFKRKYTVECFIKNIHCNICIILFLK